MLPDCRKEALQVLGLLDHQQPVIRLQMQHVQQLSGFAVPGDGLEVLVGFQQVVQSHAVAAQGLDRRCSARHIHRVERH